MAKVRSNEILDKALSTDASVIPRFDITDALGNVLATNVALTLKNPVIQKGMAVDKLAMDECLAASGTTTGTDSALVLTQENFVLFDGALIRFRLHIDSGATPTIDVNNTGAKKLMQDKYKPMQKVFAGTWVTAVYCEAFDFFVLQGSGAKNETLFGNDPGQINTFELCMLGHSWDPFYRRRF